MDIVLGIIMACRSFKGSFRVGVSEKGNKDWIKQI
jgi:hypothetical protein